MQRLDKTHMCNEIRTEKGKKYFSIRFLTILLQWENGFSQRKENFMSVAEQLGPSIGGI